jgi:hypothetical protein
VEQLWVSRSYIFETLAIIELSQIFSIYIRTSGRRRALRAREMKSSETVWRLPWVAELMVSGGKSLSLQGSRSRR